MIAAPTLLFVGGSWRPGADGAEFPVEDPASGDVLCHVADATPADFLAALDAAASAQAGWATTSPRVRSELLRAACGELLKRTGEFARLITLEMGKPLIEAEAEVRYAADFLQWFAEEAPRISGRYQTAPDGGSRLLVTKRPVGPCLFITPWNFPLAMVTRKVAPAVAAGCTCLLKPAELTPVTALAFAELLAGVGLPGGVVNVLPTSSPGAGVTPLFDDPRLRKLSFTGSTAVGRELLSLAARSVLRTSMELGGNAPFLVFEDADLDVAVEAAVVAKLRNMGEACTAANRFLVHDSLVEDFAQRLATAFTDMTVGPGLEPTTQLGPLVEASARVRVHALVNDAVDRGARVLCGGVVRDGPGWFYPPTVLVEVPPDADVMRTECFGPVAPIASFTSEDEAVTLANDTVYGLAAYVMTLDEGRALRLADQLEVGMLGVNRGVVSNPAAPFGGVKQSGLGREGGSEGIEDYLETVYVALPS